MMYSAASPWAKLSGPSWFGEGAAPAQACLAFSSDPYFFVRNCAELPAESPSSPVPLMPWLVQNKSESSFWIWMIASAGSCARGMPV